MKLKLRGIILGLAAFGMLAAGAQARAAEKVVYLLPAQASLPAFGPWMVAREAGYYAREGLEVEFVSAKGGVDSAKQVGAGNAVVGGSLGDTPILVRPNGVPVKTVALIGGGGLMQLVVHKKAGINGPADLRGKTVSIMSFSDTTYYALLGMISTAGLTKNDINAQPAGPVNIWKLFVAGEADAMAAVPDWIVDAETAGADIEIIPANAYFQSMAQTIVASDRVIAEKPELVGKLVRATLAGLSDIMANPKSAAAVYVKAMPAHAGRESQIARVFELYNKYVYAGQARLGEMDRARLQKLQDFYVATGIVSQPLPLDDLYTNAFIK